MMRIRSLYVALLFATLLVPMKYAISRDRVEDARNVLKEAEEIEVKIISVDRKNRVIGLSIKAKDVDDEKEAIKEHNKKSEPSAPATIGDLIKAQMGSKGE